MNNPPPPPGSTCSSSQDGGTVCTTHFSIDFSGGVLGTCFAGTADAFDILVSVKGTVDFRGEWNAAGDELQEMSHVHLVGAGNAFTNSVTGKSLAQPTVLTITVVFAVPGNLDTTTLTFSGLNLRVTVQGMGVIALQAGRAIFPPGSPPVFRGPDKGSDLSQLCTALA